MEFAAIKLLHDLIIMTCLLKSKESHYGNFTSRFLIISAFHKVKKLFNFLHSLCANRNLIKFILRFAFLWLLHTLTLSLIKPPHSFRINPFVALPGIIISIVCERGGARNHWRTIFCIM